MESKLEQYQEPLNKLKDEAHITACMHGFYDEYNELICFLNYGDPEAAKYSKHVERNMILSQLAKIAGEVGEAVSAIQHNDQGNFAEELADVVIRVLDLAGFQEINIGAAITNKMGKNVVRPYLHGKVC